MLIMAAPRRGTDAGPDWVKIHDVFVDRDTPPVDWPDKFLAHILDYSTMKRRFKLTTEQFALYAIKREFDTRS